MGTKASEVRRNDRTIDRSIQKFTERTEKTISSGYLRFMEASLSHLIEVHETSDHHVNEDSTLACGIFHDGEIIKIWGHKGGQQVKWKKATERLLAISSLLPQEGWVGVLLSGMKGWYNVDKEMGHLQDTASWSKDNFAKYFKPLSA